MNLRDYLTESMSKEYAYRIKIAADCSDDHLSKLEETLMKYNIISAANWRRTPIEENPIEFVRAKGVNFISEVCSTDVILKYPINDRILEVYVAANLGIDLDRIIVTSVKDPRGKEADAAGKRVVRDKGRHVTAEDSVLSEEDQTHYDIETDEALGLYGEAYNTKFVEALMKVKKEKGADYFRSYPSKDQIMGDTHRSLVDTLMNVPNMGTGGSGKAADHISQSSRRN